MKVIIAFACFIFFGINLQAQDTAHVASYPRNEIAVDVANILTFLKRDAQSYSLYYRRALNQTMRIRSAANFQVSNDPGKGKYIDFSTGLDFSIYRSAVYHVYYGGDLYGSYAKGNFQPNINYKAGVSPFIGASCFITKRLSISTEPRINFTYFIYRNKSSFDPAANSETYEIGFGTIGLLMIGFHF